VSTGHPAYPLDRAHGAQDRREMESRRHPGRLREVRLPAGRTRPAPTGRGPRAVVAVCHRLVQATTRRSCVIDVWRETALEPKQTTTSADLQALQETGATGLEPATSGVTGPVRGSRRLTMMDAQSLYSCGFWGFSWSDSAWLSEASSDVCCPFAAREAPLPSAAGTGAVLAPVIVESGSAFDRLPLSA
jgi:hypothetical protein